MPSWFVATVCLTLFFDRESRQIRLYVSHETLNIIRPVLSDAKLVCSYSVPYIVFRSRKQADKIIRQPVSHETLNVIGPGLSDAKLVCTVCATLFSDPASR